MSERSDAAEWGSALDRAFAAGKRWHLRWEQQMSSTYDRFDPVVVGYHDEAKARQQFAVLVGATTDPKFSWAYRNPELWDMDEGRRVLPEESADA